MSALRTMIYISLRSIIRENHVLGYLLSCKHGSLKILNFSQAYKTMKSPKRFISIGLEVVSLWFFKLSTSKLGINSTVFAFKFRYLRAHSRSGLKGFYLPIQGVCLGQSILRHSSKFVNVLNALSLEKQFLRVLKDLSLGR